MANMMDFSVLLCVEKICNLLSTRSRYIGLFGPFTHTALTMKAIVSSLVDEEELAWRDLSSEDGPRCVEISKEDSGRTYLQSLVKFWKKALQRGTDIIPAPQDSLWNDLILWSLEENIGTEMNIIEGSKPEKQ